jgi:hypothetical protein
MESAPASMPAARNAVTDHLFGAFRDRIAERSPDGVGSGPFDGRNPGMGTRTGHRRARPRPAPARDPPGLARCRAAVRHAT